MAGGLGEPLVELAPFSPGHVRDEPLEDRPAGFVQVQPLVQELAQETSALGDPEGIDFFDSAPRLISGFGTAASQVGSNVPGGQQPKPGHRSTGGGVDHLVHLARLEPEGK